MPKTFFRNGATILSVLWACVVFPASARAGTVLYDASLTLHAFIGGIPMPIGGAAAGSGTIQHTRIDTGPAPVAVPKSAVGVTAAAYWPIFPPTHFYSTYAIFANDAGKFFAGGDPAAGKGTVSHKAHPNRAGSWFIREGKNAFGGTLGLLGKLGAFAQFEIAIFRPSGPVPGIFTGTSSWNMIRALGRSQMKPLNPYTNIGMFVNKTGGLSDPYSNLVTTYTKFASGTPWTTGTVTVVAKEGSYATILRRSGYDTTTPGGVRNIQLVTPALTHWARNQERPSYHTGHIAILKIRLVPEPSSLAMFAAGVGALLLRHRTLRPCSFRRDSIA